MQRGDLVKAALVFHHGAALLSTPALAPVAFFCEKQAGQGHELWVRKCGFMKSYFTERHGSTRTCWRCDFPLLKSRMPIHLLDLRLESVDLLTHTIFTVYLYLFIHLSCLSLNPTLQSILQAFNSLKYALLDLNLVLNTNNNELVSVCLQSPYGCWPSWLHSKPRPRPWRPTTFSGGLNKRERINWWGKKTYKGLVHLQFLSDRNHILLREHFWGKQSVTQSSGCFSS